MNLSQEEFNKNVGENLAKYRKYNNLTQVALAEKLNYSDKAVSKWESGESLPDIYVLKSIADLYGVTVNDLITSRAKPRAPINKLKQFFIPALSCCIVWLIALISFVCLRILLPDFQKHYLPFIIAIPVSAIIVLIFSCIYKNWIVQLISISVLIWTTILTLILSLDVFVDKINLFYFVGIPVQVAFLLWYLYLYLIKKKQSNK